MTQLARVRAASTGWVGAPGLNTFYFSAGTTDPGSAISQTEADLCVTRVRTAFADCNEMFPNAWNVQVSPTVDVINDVTGDLVNSFTTPQPAIVNGASGGSFAPLACMLLVRMKTGVFSDGRKIQGRAFLGPVGLNVDGNGSPNAAMLTEAQAFITALNDAGPGGVPVLRIWRRPRAAAAGPPVVTQRDGMSAVVTAMSIPDFFAILRSRRD